MGIDKTSRAYRNGEKTGHVLAVILAGSLVGTAGIIILRLLGVQ